LAAGSLDCHEVTDLSYSVSKVKRDVLGSVALAKQGIIVGDVRETVQSDGISARKILQRYDTLIKLAATSTQHDKSSKRFQS
jgi:hypothetical protein